MNIRFTSALVASLLFSPAVFAAEHAHGGHAAHGHHAMPMAIEATGEVRKITAASGNIKLKHDPIPALGWPAMVMDFKLQDPALANGLKAGDAVTFSFVSGEAGHVVTAIQKRGH